ncbi:MAG: hypothetical protein QXL15_01490 [Candidatus Korarchaeota archaeon]
MGLKPEDTEFINEVRTKATEKKTMVMEPKDVKIRFGPDITTIEFSDDEIDRFITISLITRKPIFRKKAKFYIIDGTNIYILSRSKKRKQSSSSQ